MGHGRICGLHMKLYKSGSVAAVTERTNLVLDEELDTLDGSGGSLGDGSRDTTHCYPLLATASLFPGSYQCQRAGAVNAISARRRCCDAHGRATYS
jgi:hypothetical protein